MKKRKRPLELDPKTSARLGKIRQQDTRVEMIVRRMVYALGHRYRVRNRDLPGSPDLANRSKRWTCFVHGCFWHAHRDCPRATVPKRNRAFWKAKFRDNRERDQRVLAALAEQGFSTLVIWECETGNARRLRQRLTRFLRAV